MIGKRVALLTLMTILLLLGTTPTLAQEARAVTLLHFSDYHSHAQPFYAEGQANSGGIARAIAYLQPLAAEPGTLIFSGGDSMNKSTPAWSDKFQCAEWPWFNGILDAMAFGNHDADYGPELFARCREQIDYPILSSNTLAAGGEPLFQYDGKSYRIFEANGVKVGVFALAGSDFSRLVRPEIMPAEGVTFGDRIEVARREVAAMQAEGAEIIVLIGHSLYEEDVELARAVPGIDLIFGSHSHRKEGLTLIPGTETRIISPSQYLSYISRVQITLQEGGIAAIEGELVPMSSDRPEDPAIKQRVEQMQAELQADPAYAPLFTPIGEAAMELSTEGQFTGESVLGNFVMDIFRSAAGTHLAISTASSFREPIPPGTILEETLRSAMPYKNKVLIFEMSGAQVQELLDYSVSRSPSDFFSQLSGVRFTIEDGRAANVQILQDPGNPAAGFVPLDPAGRYTVATSDFQALIAGGYKEIFARAASQREAGIEDIRDEVRRYIHENSPVSARLDGRMSDAAPALLPETGRAATSGPTLALLGLLLAALGWLLARERQADT